MNIETLFKNLETITSISSSLKAYLRIAFKEHELKSNDQLGKNIRIENPIIFVRKGFLKTKLESRIDPGRKLLNFHFEGTILPFLHERKLDDYTLETYSGSDSTLLALSIGHTQNLYKLFPEFGLLISKLHGEIVMDLFHQAFDLHHSKAEERLDKLLLRYPNIFQIATVTDIAASIGMHPNTLSALKNK